MFHQRRPVWILGFTLGLLLLLLQGGVVGSLRAASSGPDRSLPQSPAQATISLCGRVLAYTPPTLILPGTLTIGLQTFLISPGAAINGEALLTLSNNVCINAATNAAGNIVSLTVTLAPTETPAPTDTAAPTNTPAPLPGATNTPEPGIGTTLRACGVVTAYVPASALGTGLLIIGGQTLVIGPGVLLDGDALLRQGADVCVELTVGVNGQVLSGRVTPNVGLTVRVCGVVTDFQAATATAPGSITVNGQTFPIAAGAVLDNQNLIRVGSNLCLNAQLNAAGQISSGGITLNVGGSVNLCGTVTAFTPSTANALGSITIGGQTIPIAAGAALAGQDQVRLGNTYCLDGTLNAAG